MKTLNILMAVAFLALAACAPAIDPNTDNGRTYTARSVDECSRIKYMCVDGMVPWSDETGCGCEPAADEPSEVPPCAATLCEVGSICVEGKGCVKSETFIVCPEERQQACTKEYLPVCGKSVLNVGDTVFETYGNKCMACAAMKVVGYTQGECDSAVVDRSYKSTDPDACAAMRFVCGEGQQYFGDETGCGCEPATDAPSEVPPCAATTCLEGNSCVEGVGCVPYTTCKDPRPEACTMQYDPVCADKDNGIRCITEPCPSTDKVTYGNGCSACGDKDVYGYVPGECPATDGTANTDGKKPAPGAIWCEPMDPVGACTMDYNPVCGNDGKTYGNACGACRAQNQYYVPGECSA